MDCVIIHYSEIGLKGLNRPYFERSLINDIKKRTGLNVKREWGRLVMDYDESKISTLSKIPGIANYSPAIKAGLDIKEIISKALSMKIKEPFKVTTRRSNKKFIMTSPQINEKVGEALYNTGMKVDINNPSTELFIEVCDKNVYLYTERIKGIGGLPVGVTGKLLSLISGGIDSPVASYEMIKRGCEVVLIHFYNKREGVKEKILELAGKVAEYQGFIKIYLVPFLDAQKQVIMHVPATHRMITYRRLMLKIAEKVLKKEECLGFITGDNVAQVASQTLKNMKAIWSVTKENIYAPLMSNDKEETIKTARQIGTYEISIKPYSDCCSYIIAEHPETRAEIKDIKKYEKAINTRELIKNSLKNSEIHTINA